MKSGQGQASPSSPVRQQPSHEACEEMLNVDAALFPPRPAGSDADPERPLLDHLHRRQLPALLILLLPGEAPAQVLHGVHQQPSAAACTCTSPRQQLSAALAPVPPDSQRSSAHALAPAPTHTRFHPPLPASCLWRCCFRCLVSQNYVMFRALVSLPLRMVQPNPSIRFFLLRFVTPMGMQNVWICGTIRCVAQSTAEDGP